jgi:hypothetical protein
MTGPLAQTPASNLMMTNRILVGTAPNQAVGLMYQELLIRAGIPVISVPAQDLGVILNAGPAELYLEDPSLADDPEVMATIRAVLEGDEEGSAPPDSTS